MRGTMSSKGLSIMRIVLIFGGLHHHVSEWKVTLRVEEKGKRSNSNATGDCIRRGRTKEAAQYHQALSTLKLSR